jgi:hypothetical protein
MTIQNINDELYATQLGVIVPLSEEEILFHRTDNGERHVLTADVMAALETCHQFASMDEHVAAVARRLPKLASQPRAIRTVLEQLAQRGLLARSSTVMQSYSAAAKTPAVEEFQVTVRTRDNTQGLSALLDSMRAEKLRNECSLRFHVIDESKQDDAQTRNAEITQLFAEKSGAEVKYFGRGKQEAWINALAQRLPESVRPNLHELTLGNERSGPGCAFNLGLLMSPSQPMLWIDDTRRMNPHRMLESASGIALRGDVARTARYAVDADNAPRTIDGAIDEHARMLGQPLGRVLQQQQNADAIAQLRGQNLPALRELAADKRVIATVNGVDGSSEYAHSVWLFMLDQAAQKNLRADSARYEDVMQAEHLQHGVLQTRPQRYAHYWPFAVDSRLPLGYCGSEGASAETMFGCMTLALQPDGIAMHSNMLLDRINPSAPTRAGVNLQAQIPNFNRLLADWFLLNAEKCHAINFYERSHFLAAALDDLASAGERYLQSYLWEYLSYQRTETVRALQSQLENMPAGIGRWAEDLRAITQANGLALMQAAAPRLADMPEQFDAPRCAGALSERLRKEASKLRDWATIIQVVKNER